MPFHEFYCSLSTNCFLFDAGDGGVCAMRIEKMEIVKSHSKLKVIRLVADWPIVQYGRV